jgi:hypothetical protein
MTEALTDRQQYAELVPEVRRDLARHHIEAPGSRMRWLNLAPGAPLPAYLDPLCYDYQREGERASREDVDKVATLAEPRFPVKMAELNNDPQALSVAKNAADLLRDNKNIWTVTPHGDILDMAFVVKYFYNMLLDQGHDPRSTLAVLGQALPEIGIELFEGQDPASTVAIVGMQCDHVVLTWPRQTESAKGAISRLPGSEVDRTNKAAMQVIDDEFSTGGVLAALAPTGTTKMETDRNGALILPTPSHGTLELVVRPDTYTVLVPAWFKSEHVVVEMPVQPVEVSSETEFHLMLKFLAEVLTEKVEFVNFTYNIPIRRRFGRTALKLESSEPSET